MFWIVIVGLAIFFIVKLVQFLHFYFSNIDAVRNHAVIKFDDFVKYYQINPDKWDLRNMRVGYTSRTYDELSSAAKEDYDYFMVLRSSSIWEEERESFKNRYLGKKFFRFSFIDSLRYNKWHKDMIKRKQKEEDRKEEIKLNNQHKEDIIMLLEGVQKDINKLRKQSQDELNQAMNTMKKVKERIG